jgi:hypothetical protein
VPATNILKLGATQQFTLAVEVGPGVPPSGPAPLWISTNPPVLIINSSGTATGVSVGEATVQVTFGGQTAARQLHVVP